MRTSFEAVRRTGVAVLLGLALAAAPGPAFARTENTGPGSCDGFTNYAAELQPQLYQLVAQTDVGGGITEVEVSVLLQNLLATRFHAASVLPDLASLADLGVLRDATAQPADFGAIDEYASVASTAGLKLRLPSANVAALLARLQAGQAPVTVHADERNVLAPNVRVGRWSSFEDGLYHNLYGNVPPSPPPPYTPGERLQVGFLLIGFDNGSSSLLDGFQPGELLYLDEDPADPLQYLPEKIRRNVRVIRVDKTLEPIDGGTADHSTQWNVELEVATGDPLTSMIETGSYCLRDTG